jgi:PAS domain S-box-containing protein
MYRVSFALVSLLLCVLLVARNLNLLPDPDAAALARRQAACEAVALACALAAQRNEPAAAEAFVRAVARRNPDVLSIGVRDGAGKLVVDTGGHDEHWGGYAGDRSTPTHVHVAVSRADGSPWGRVELAFRPLPYARWSLVGGSLLPLLGFVWGGSFVVTTLFLRGVLRRVDLAQARVVPDRVRATLNALAEGILVLDKRGVIALANDAFARSVGTTADALRGRNVSDLPWHGGTVELTPEEHPWVRVLRDAAPQMGQMLGLRSGGTRKTMSVNSTPIFGEDGTCRGALATFDDLTPVEEAKAAAEAASRAKGEFLANVSHEIRTPMNAIMGMTELVLEGGRLTAEQRECLAIVDGSARSLLGVINDLLDLSKIEAGKFDLDPVEFDLRTALEDTLEGFALRAHQKGLELACDVAAEVPEVLVGDPTRLRQVVVNLVGNALKFTDRGEVVVRVRADEHDPTRLHFGVSDTGVGIPADKTRAIFEPFTQADGSTTRKYGGTGLGLTISARLVGLMGGDIWAESEVGRGSTFQFTARFGVPARAGAPPALPDGSLLHGLAVLVVDDNPTARRALAAALGRFGLKPTAADGAASALAELERAAAAGTPFPLLVADATLPDTDGFALAQTALRRQLTGAAVLLLSSPDLARDVERCHQIGAAAHLQKPVKRERLLRALRQVVDPAAEAHRTGRPESDALPTAAPTGLNVLLVDDNPFNQKVATMKLERRGYRVRVAGTGREALAALAEGAVDLMFTDVQMPDMDGYELTAAVRAREAAGGRRLPIIAMTAHAMKGARERCLAAGMDDYVSKPIRDDELMAAIVRACPDRLAASEDTSDLRSQDTVGRAPVVAAALEEDAVLARVGGNRGVLSGLIGVFYQDCQTLMSSLRAAIRSGDAAGVQTAAHTIKGMVAFFEARAATEAAGRLEDAGVRQELAGTRQLFDALARELSLIEVELSKYVPAPSEGWHLGLTDHDGPEPFGRPNESVADSSVALR